MTEDEHIKQARAEEIANTPSKYRGQVERAYQGRSKAIALKAMCLQCSGYQRVEVTHCQSYRCPLWLHRPYQTDIPEDHLPTDQPDKVQP